MESKSPEIAPYVQKIHTFHLNTLKNMSLKDKKKTQFIDDFQ